MLVSDRCWSQIIAGLRPSAIKRNGKKKTGKRLTTNPTVQQMGPPATNPTVLQMEPQLLRYHACCVRVTVLAGLRDFDVDGASVRSVLSSELEKPGSRVIV